MSKFLKFPTEFTNSNWTCVASNNNTSSPIWVALADSGPFRVARSTNGVNWTIVQGITASIVNKTWTSIAFGNGRFVAVASSGTNRIITSVDGITWTELVAATAGYTDRAFTGIAWNGTVFAVVARGVATGAVQYSVNGTDTYQTTDAASSQTWNSIAWNGTTWIIVADGAANVCVNRNGTATPGATWTAATAAAAGTWQAVSARGTQFVAVANSGTDRLMVSADEGVNWTASNPAALTGIGWKALASNGTNIVAVGQDGAQSVRIATSADGTTWATAAGATTNNNSNIWNGVASLSTSNSYVAVSRSGGQRRILFTSDTFATSTICNDSYPSTRTSSPAYLDVEKVISAQEGSPASTTLVLNILTPSASFDVVTLTFGEDLTGATHEVILDAIVDANSAVSSPEGALTVSLPENRNVTLSFA